MSRFIFHDYSFNPATGEASFRYGYDDGRAFEEKVSYGAFDANYNSAALDRALRLAFLVIGTSYAKTFPIATTELSFAIDDWTADFLNKVYQEGLSQYAYENQLTRNDLPHFDATGEQLAAVPYEGSGVVALQSGGKDSLLVAELLKRNGRSFTPWYLTSNVAHHPAVLDTFDDPLVIATRAIDRAALAKAASEGARNGHVPVTYIVQSLALVQAILLNKSEILVSIAHEGEEEHARIGDLSVTHQWSKTWAAEQLFAEYVTRYVSPSISIGSPLRKYSEAKVAELFVALAWKKYGTQFSSCNVANYQQGADNSKLTWCGNCPKCANSYLLFAPYLDAAELRLIFNGTDLFTVESLQETFKGLLGIEGVTKPFECIGEVDELRFMYALARQRGGYASLSFEVPTSHFDPNAEYPAQELAF